MSTLASVAAGGATAVPATRLPRWPALRGRVPAAIAFYLAFVATVSAVLAVLPPARSRLAWLSGLVSWLTIPTSANLAYAAYLGILAGACRRRMRAGWWFLVIALVLPDIASSISLGASDPVQYVGGVSMTLVFLVLLATRRDFVVVGEKGNGRRAAASWVGLIVLGSAIGFVLLTAFPGTLERADDRLGWSIDNTLGGLGDTDAAQIDGRGPRWVTDLCGLLGAAAFLTAAWVLFRPQRHHRLLGADDEQRLRGLLDRAGERDSLGYFATRRDKAVMFSATGKAAVTYRVVAGVSLASGDPVGDPEAWPAAISAWLDEARRHGWPPAVMGASETGAQACVRGGLAALALGDEAVLELAEFSLDGRAMRGVRHAVRRLERAGYSARVRRHADLGAADMAQVVAQADAWRDTESERGFSMALGRLGDPLDGRCVLVECLDEGGTLRALMSFVPWGAHGLSLDLMRRDRAADNGVNEFLVAALAAHGRTLGIDRVSLNFAMFRAVFEEGSRIGAGPVLRLWRAFLVLGSRWWQLESLYRSNAKYQPVWVPRFLCFAEARDLPRIGMASAIAEGFLTVPDLRGVLRRRPPDAGATATSPPPGALPPQPTGGVPARPALDLSASPDVDPRPYAGLPEQMRVRRVKLDRLRAAGVDPYPVGHPRTDTLADLVQRFGTLPPGAATGEQVAVTGRVVLARDHGGVCFARLRDGTGDLQVMLSRDVTGPAALARWKRDVDLGDHVGVEGEIVTSRRGELSVEARRWTLTAKCLRPLPDKRRGLTEPEARVRQRYVDLITNPHARRMMHVRSAAISSVRGYLTSRGYLEVETPILQPVHGGANARPFTTHINAYDMRLYLRIAPELYLKRLMVGGAERVFELNRNFRNEGADATHNPEFTMLEAYQAYGDYDSMQAVVQEMVQGAARDALGTTVIRRDGAEHDIGGAWRSVTVNDAISAALGEEVTADTPAAELGRRCDQAGIPYDPAWGRGLILLEIYEHLVEDRTVTPTFYRDFPTDVSPLTRQHRVDPRLAERWDLVAFGAEIGTAYSELIDPVEQRRRLTEQSLLAAGGDAEAMELDEDFLRALEYAMPPAGGMGMGVDRMVMMLTGTNIRETLLFPLVRPGG